jgi:tetratricopeptide (TPR) repeat protein
MLNSLCIDSTTAPENVSDSKRLTRSLWSSYTLVITRLHFRLESAGRFDEAIQAYDKALAINPDDPQIGQQRFLVERSSRRTHNHLLNSVKPTIDTWDVFDTLLARYCIEPEEIFKQIAIRFNHSEFIELRERAQNQLDALAKPYNVFDIYDRLGVLLGDASLARRFLEAEIEAELDNLIPIQRNLSRLQSNDLLVSDMYLTPEIVQRALLLVTEGRSDLPVVLGNWGKASGLIWPMLGEFYNLRRHHGDNPHADLAMPIARDIVCELITDAQPTEWEAKVRDAGLPELAQTLRQVRLSVITDEHHVLHQMVVGPLLTLFVLHSIALVEKYGENSHYFFCSRDCDDLLLIFGTIFPASRAEAIDFSRRLLNGQEHDAYFSGKLGEQSIIVDLISSGRSLLGFLQRIGATKHRLDILLFIDDLLEKPQQEALQKLREAKRLQNTMATSELQRTYSTLEAMIEAGYPAVNDMLLESYSGALIKAFFPNDKLDSEQDYFTFKSLAIKTLVKVLRHRKPQLFCSSGTMLTLITAAVTSIVANEEILKYFPTFIAREARNPY